MINQAVRLSMVDNGEPESWDLPEKAFHYTSNVNYFNQYFAPYLKASSYKKVYIPAHENSLAVALSDGGAFMLCRQETTVAFFYLTNYSDLDKPNFYKDNKKFFEFQMGKLVLLEINLQEPIKIILCHLHTLGMELIVT